MSQTGPRPLKSRAFLCIIPSFLPAYLWKLSADFPVTSCFFRSVKQDID